MLCAVTSSARWWASRPRSVVLRAKKEETGIGLRLEVQRPQLARGLRDGRGGGVGRRRPVAGLLLAAHQAGEVVEERELLAHEGAVDAVLAGDLAEQAAQLGAALPGVGADV